MNSFCCGFIGNPRYCLAICNVQVQTYYRDCFQDWTLSWGGAGAIYGWGHNHRGQLGGVDGAKVKIPTQCEALSLLRPVQLVGGEQTLFAVTAEGNDMMTC